MTVPEEELSAWEGKVFPPGFRFHPTDEELVLYYLKRKICRRRHRMSVIAETDVYKWDPEDLPGLSKLKTADRQWFFFSPRDRKYPNGGRASRATRNGYWKATGKDRIITYNSRDVGLKKTLVFYKGRSPIGKRTDWVMHEYTMNDDELNRCESEKDYYALYKVFKKSGPGPKSGEQYGAPFKEEDWAEEEFGKGGLVDQGNTYNLIGEGAPVDEDRSSCQLKSSDDLDEFVNIIAEEPLVVPPLSVADYGYSLEDLVYEEEALSNLIDQSIDVHLASQKYDVQASFDMTQSGTSQLQLHEASEVTSAPKSHAPNQHVVEEDFLEDFLEMNDLVGPQPTVQNSERLVASLENQQFSELDSLSELDLYEDASMFCGGFETGQHGQIPQPYVKNMENEAINPVSNFCCNNSVQAPIDYEQMYSSDAQNVSFQQWSHDQMSSVYTAAEAHHRTIPPSISGAVYDGNFSNHGSGADENQSGKQNDGTDSWISSVLWAFVESIPTTPASASESSALVNRAFERMSSFGRVRINGRKTNVGAVDTVATSRSSGKCESGFLCFSLLGVMCAILWVLIGTSIRVLGRYIST